jgi:hypothetical protein
MTIAELIAELSKYPGDYKFVLTIGEDTPLRFNSGDAQLTGPFQFDGNDEARVVYMVGE